jgi:hypothetical protein
MWADGLTGMMSSMSGCEKGDAVELRLAHADDAAAVLRIAALDDALALEGQALLALVDGDAVAALSLQDERVVANPFLPTAEVVAILRMRAEQLSGSQRRRRVRFVPRLRPA